MRPVDSALITALQRVRRRREQRALGRLGGLQGDWLLKRSGRAIHVSTDSRPGSSIVKAFITFAALAALLGPAHAAGERAALRGTAASKFNAEDIALMKASVGQALTSDKDGDTLEWRNDKTGASGAVTPLNRLSWNGLDCRRLRIVNAHRRTTEQGVYRFCEKPAGRWKLVGPDRPQP